MKQMTLKTISPYAWSTQKLVPVVEVRKLYYSQLGCASSACGIREALVDPWAEAQTRQGPMQIVREGTSKSNGHAFVGMGNQSDGTRGHSFSSVYGTFYVPSDSMDAGERC